MFISLRDLWFAKGRFALMTSVVALVSVLVVMLSGLTAGLAADNVSAIGELPATHLAFQLPSSTDTPSFAASRVDRATWQEWVHQSGVEQAAPLGISQLRVDTDTGGLSIALFGVQPQSFIAPQVTTGTNLTPNQEGLVLSQDLADIEGVRVGDQIRFGDGVLPVVGIAPTLSYSHTPVVWAPLEVWQRWTSASGTDTATTVALNLANGTDTAAIDTTLGTTTVERAAAFDAIGAFTEENGSLTMIRGFLFAISALVVGAFFTVWTIQRRHEIGVLKALGASNSYLLRDALGQALLILVVAGGVGLGIGAGLGALAATTVPFVLDPATTVIPIAAMIAVGGLGAGAAVRRITSVDPLIALGAS